MAVSIDSLDTLQRLLDLMEDHAGTPDLGLSVHGGGDFISGWLFLSALVTAALFRRTTCYPQAQVVIHELRFQ
jgi:hypothetical protein